MGIVRRELTTNMKKCHDFELHVKLKIIIVKEVFLEHMY